MKASSDFLISLLYTIFVTFCYKYPPFSPLCRSTRYYVGRHIFTASNCRFRSYSDDNVIFFQGFSVPSTIYCRSDGKILYDSVRFTSFLW